VRTALARKTIAIGAGYDTQEAVAAEERDVTLEALIHLPYPLLQFPHIARPQIGLDQCAAIRQTGNAPEANAVR